MTETLVAVTPDVTRLGHSVGGMRFAPRRGVELEKERALPTKQREEKGREWTEGEREKKSRRSETELCAVRDNDGRVSDSLQEIMQSAGRLF